MVCACSAVACVYEPISFKDVITPLSDTDLNDLDLYGRSQGSKEAQASKNIVSLTFQLIRIESSWHAVETC